MLYLGIMDMVILSIYRYVDNLVIEKITIINNEH